MDKLIGSKPITRCTVKAERGYEVRFQIAPLVQKLGEIEDVEEWLGVDIMTLLKALILQEDLFLKVDGEIAAYDGPVSLNADLNDDGDLCDPFLETGCGDYRTREFGKTWAFCKEDLE